MRIQTATKVTKSILDVLWIEAEPRSSDERFFKQSMSLGVAAKVYSADDVATAERYGVEVDELFAGRSGKRE